MKPLDHFRPCLLALIAGALAVPGVAEARRARADIAIERVSATPGAIAFTVVNRGSRKAPATTVRAGLRGASGGARTVARVRQSALRPGARKRHTVRLATVPAGTWRAEVCAVPRTDRNDCATGKQRLTSDPAPRAKRPLPAATAVPEPTATAVPEPTATATAAPEPTATSQPTATATPQATATASPTATATATASPTATAAPSSTPIAPADPRDAATAYRQNPAHDGRTFGDGPQPPLTTVWTRDLDGNLGYPLIAGGRVFALTDKGMLRVLDLRNGALLWSHAIGTRPVGAAFDDGRVFTTDEYGLTIAFDAASGLVLWSRSTSAQSPPVASDGRLYTGGTGALTVYDATTGELLRSQEGRRSGNAVMLTLDADKVYAATRCGGALAYHRNAPGIAWQGPEGGCSTGQWSLPGALHAGRLFNPNPLGSYDEDGTVSDASTGALLGAFPEGSPPAFSGGRGVFVEAGTVITRDVATNLEAWRFAEGEMVGAPLIAGSTVYVGSRAGVLHALDLATGAEKWRTTSPTGQLTAAQNTLVAIAGHRIVALRPTSAPPQTGPTDRATPPVDVGPPAPAPGATTNLYGNSDHTGAINLAEPRPPLRRRWTATGNVIGALVADGRVFSLDLVASVGARVRALDPATGAELWRHDFPGSTRAGFAYDQGRVYVVHQTGIHALAAASGALLWSDPRNSASLASSPTALDGELYVSSNYATTRYRGDTGEKVWTAGGCCSPSDRAPSVDATRVYAGNVCEPLSRATGQPVPGSTGRCTPDDHAAVPLYRGHLLADLGRGRGTSLDFDVQRGTVVGGAGSSFPAAVIGNVLLTSDVYNVTAREFPGGTPRWNWYAGPMYNDIVMPPLIVGRTVYVVLDQPGLRALDLDTGQVVFSQSLGLEFPERYTAGSAAALAVGEGLLLVPTPRGLMAFESA